MDNEENTWNVHNNLDTLSSNRKTRELVDEQVQEPLVNNAVESNGNNKQIEEEIVNSK